MTNDLVAFGQKAIAVEDKDPWRYIARTFAEMGTTGVDLGRK